MMLPLLRSVQFSACRTKCLSKQIASFASHAFSDTQRLLRGTGMVGHYFVPALRTAGLCNQRPLVAPGALATCQRVFLTLFDVIFPSFFKPNCYVAEPHRMSHVAVLCFSGKKGRSAGTPCASSSSVNRLLPFGGGVPNVSRYWCQTNPVLNPLSSATF
jgi:hypothetical protein